MKAKPAKNINPVPTKFTQKDYNYDDGVDPKDLLTEVKPQKRKLFHT